MAFEESKKFVAIGKFQLKVAAYPNYIYQPQKKVMKAMFSQESVILSTGGGQDIPGTRSFGGGRVYLVPGPFQGVGYLWSQVLWEGRVGYLRGRYPEGHIEGNFEGTYDCH